MSETFVVQIKNSQNSSWQGTVAWAEGKEKRAFRSELELIQLINSAMEEQYSPDPEETETSDS